MTIATSYEQVTNNSPDGAQMGQSATEKIGLFGVTPIVQPASSNQAAVTATSVANNFTWTANDPAISNGAATIDDGNTVGDDNDAGDAIGVLEVQGDANRTDIAALIVLVNQMRTDLINLGNIKGAA